MTYDTAYIPFHEMCQFFRGFPREQTGQGALPYNAVSFFGKQLDPLSEDQQSPTRGRAPQFVDVYYTENMGMDTNIRDVV